MIPFSGDRYEAIYHDIFALINATSENSYHGRKLKQLLMFIATDGRYVNFFSSIFLYSYIS